MRNDRNPRGYHRSTIRRSVLIGGFGSVMMLFGLTLARAQDYCIDWSTIDGGAMTMSGGALVLSGTIGQPDAGVLSGGGFELLGGFWGAASATAPPAPGDCDGDGDVDLDDHAHFVACFGGPNGQAIAPECECFDLDADGEVDLLDFAAFCLDFTGAM